MATCEGKKEQLQYVCEQTSPFPAIYVQCPLITSPSNLLATKTFKGVTESA